MTHLLDSAHEVEPVQPLLGIEGHLEAVPDWTSARTSQSRNKVQLTVHSCRQRDLEPHVLGWKLLRLDRQGAIGFWIYAPAEVKLDPFD